MSVLNHLKPESIWKYFEEICKIPRISKNESKIRKYLLEFANKNNLDSKEDEVGNILITKPASPGMENRKTVVLQSHMDMVGEKNADYPHNWDTDPIIPLIKDGWVTAKGTTLGADDGIGIAAQMAILTDPALEAGQIECLFTVDEESGMTGAINLKYDFFTGRTLLNLDSEDEGILFIGCAGGIDTVGTLKYDTISVKDNSVAFEIAVKGLHGGHSGDEIHKGYGNSVKIINRVLLDLSANFEIEISHFDGGNLRNAIPRESFTTVVLNETDVDKLYFRLRELQTILLDEYGSLERELTLSAKRVDTPQTAMDHESQTRFLNTLACCPHGVISWSKEMEDLVETSTNLASAKFTNRNSVEIVTTQRSSVESAKHYAASMIESCMKLAQAEVTHSDGYPGWKPNLSSEILKIARQSYIDLFGKEPMVRAIHAGLECGLVYEKIKGIDMISFGPTIKGAHTPEEMIDIKTTQMFWDLLIDVIKKMPIQN